LSTFQFDFKPSAQVSEDVMRKIWLTISEKPFPSVQAYVLEDREYDRVMWKLDKSPLIKSQGLFEYGKKCSPIGSEAVVFATEAFNYMVLIKKDSRVSLEENLKHELEHISRGEVKLHNEKKE